jgi:nitrite reductase/ring-hydroxylating ferredoxin subunit
MDQMTDSNQEGATGASRRAVLLGAGALGAASVLAACGGNDNTTERAPASQPPSTVPPVTSTFTEDPIPTAEPGIKAADIPVGGGKVFPDEHFVITQPTQGTFKAFDATCTHMQCTVASVSGGTINCPCHGSKYKIADGSVENGPATRALSPKTVTEKGGTLTVS